MNEKRLVKMLKALSNPNRLKLFEEIRGAGETTYEGGHGCFLNHVIEHLKIVAPTVSHPPKALVNAGVKTVGALFRDDVGNTTFTPTTASIEFDTVAPTLTSITLSGPLADATLSEDRTTSPSVWVSVIQNGASGLALSATTLATCAGASFAGSGKMRASSKPGSPTTRSVRSGRTRSLKLRATVR